MALASATLEQHHADLATLARLVAGLATSSGKASDAEIAGGIAAQLDASAPTLKAAGEQPASPDPSKQLLEDVKRYSSSILTAKSRELEEEVKRQQSSAMTDVNERFKKLEARMLGEVGKEEEEMGKFRMSGKVADSQVLKKVHLRLTDFEAQVMERMQTLQADLEKKVSFLAVSTAPRAAEAEAPSVDQLSQDLVALKYDCGELKDMLQSTRSDTSHVKRIVLACERDMEDFTAAMDAVNVDLDEMRARVDSTHSIITSRQRVEATVTAEISTMRLDMGDMQEALKAHDAWMEDVSQSLQECHERCSSLSKDIVNLRDQTQAKLDTKTDNAAWHEQNESLDSQTKGVSNLVSQMRMEVDERRRKVDVGLETMRRDVRDLEARTDRHVGDLYRKIEEEDQVLHQRLNNVNQKHEGLDRELAERKHSAKQMADSITAQKNLVSEQLGSTEKSLRDEVAEKYRDSREQVEAIERLHAQTAKAQEAKLNQVDLRIMGLQGASGEYKRDITKLRDETNTLMVKAAAHDVDIGKCTDDVRKTERLRSEDIQKHKQDMDAVYEELDQKLYEKSHLALEDHVSKLSRGVVKLAQVVGVFPGARMDDGTEEELDIDVELLNWEDCCQHMVARVDKMWKQHSAQKYRSMLDLLGKKADHSVLRLLQISQQHIESQLERVRHERELWKEVVDKRAQQPLQLALTLKDQNMQHGMMAPGQQGPPGEAGPRQSPLLKRVGQPPPKR